MRSIVLIMTMAAGLLFSIYTTGADSPRAIVLAYECFHVDSAQTGFACSLDTDGSMKIIWHKNPRGMPPKQRGLALYEFSKIGLRFVQLGGDRFEVAFTHWTDKNRRRYCRVTRNRLDFSCVDCVERKLPGDGILCEDLVTEEKK